MKIKRAVGRISLISLVALATACKYEAVTEAPLTTSNGSSSVDFESIQLPLCNGECDCDDIDSPYNDTGVLFSASQAALNSETCDVIDGQTQDCSSGRDSNVNLVKQGHGYAAFDFSKIDLTGSQLSPAETIWQCVKDNHTGLIWETKSIELSAINNTAYTYTWVDNNYSDYSSNQQGQCDQNCTTASYIQRLNDLQFCGVDNWRLPNKIELHDLVNYGDLSPAIDLDFFPHTQSGFYWTSNPDSDDIGSAWAVDFHHGRVAGTLTSNANYIRAVSGDTQRTLYSNQLPEPEISQPNRLQVASKQRCSASIAFSSPVSRFKTDSSGNILDTNTGLIWQKCLVGLSGANCTIGESEKMSMPEALDYITIANMAQNNQQPWRLPSIKELQQLNEFACEEPPLNPFVFPNVALGEVWSMTPHQTQASTSFQYQYQNSIIFYSEHESAHAVHLVKNCGVTN